MNSSTNSSSAGSGPLEELVALLELLRPVQPKGKPTKSLLGAIYANDTEMVKRFLAAGSNPNQSNKYGSTLSGAVSRRNLEILNLLVAAGAKNAGSQLPLAAERGDSPMMRRLFELGVDLEKDGGPALAAAAYHNQAEAVKLLLEKGVPVGVQDYKAVGEAARNASVDVLRVLFAAGVKPEHAGRALRLAAGSPLAFAGVKFLVEAGVDPLNHPHYAFNAAGQPLDRPVLPADAAAEANHPEVADYLRGKPIDVDALLAKEEARRREWNQDMDAAIREEREKKTAHLLRGPARSEAVQRAVALARNSALRPMLDQAGRNGETALGMAAANGDLEIVSALLEAGADPNQVDRAKRSPLYHAAEAGHTRVVERLLQAGAERSVKDDSAGAALIEAADWDDPEMVRLLLAAGADPKSEDAGGRTPMNVEHGLRGAEVKALLRQAVRERLGGKPEKGQGLSFVKAKAKGATAMGRGVLAFHQFYNDSQPDWAVLFVRAPIEEVARTYAQWAKPVRWEQDVAKKKVSSAGRYTYLLQLKESAWSIILLALGSLSEAQVQAAASTARELSRQLATRAYTYLGEDTSGAEAYELFERGELLEKATQAETLAFEPKERPRPPFEAENFPEPVFGNEGIYLPACYPKDDGYEVKLVLEGLQRADVVRADLLVWEE